jgi:hypothetical protein
MSSMRFPLTNGSSIPYFVMHRHAAQVLANHGRDVAAMAARGGLSASEAVAAIEGRPWHAMDEAEAAVELKRLVEQAYALPRGPAGGA